MSPIISDKTMKTEHIVIAATLRLNFLTIPSYFLKHISRAAYDPDRDVRAQL